MKTSNVLIPAIVFCVFGVFSGEQRPVNWNHADGPKIAGVEHGVLHSASMDIDVGYCVSLPEGYAAGGGAGGAGEARYPVIYFLHGAGGSEVSDAGGFSGLVGKMIKEKKIAPAICVFPNGGMSGYQDRPEQKVMGETLIIKELIPLIDKTYRTQAEAKGRVVGGFSMGGGGAVRLSLKYPDLFSAAGSWAGALGGRRGGAAPPELEVENLQKVAGKVRLLMIVGDKDMTFAGHKPMLDKLEQAKFPVTYKVLEGVEHNLGKYYEKTGEEMVKFLAEKF